MPEPRHAEVDTDSMGAAREHLLAANGLSLSALDRALGAALSRDLDYADLYLQLTRFETWTVEDGIVKEGGFGIEEGVGVGAVAGEKTGFAYADDFSLPALLDAALASDTPSFIAARTDDHKPAGVTERDPARIKLRFMDGLGVKG